MTKYQILHLEDNAVDAELIKETLLSDGLDVSITHVEDEESFKQALLEKHYDLILSDYNVLNFDGEQALKLARKVHPKVPFILVSGVVGDEKASQIIKDGATDYVLKDCLNKLSSSVVEAIEESLITIKNEEQSLTYEAVIKQSDIAFFKLDQEGIFNFINQCFSDLVNQPQEDIIDHPFTKFINSGCESKIIDFLTNDQQDLSLECELKEKSAEQETIWVKLYLKALSKDKKSGFIGTVTDITSLKNTEKAQKDNILELRLIHEGTNLVASSKTLEEALFQCLKLICQNINWPVGHVYYLNKQQTKLVSTAIWYIQDQIKAKRFVEITNAIDFEKGTGLPGRIWASQEPHWIEDVYKDDNFPRAKICADLGVHGASGFPVLVDKEVVAVLEFFSYESEQRNKNILRIFKLLSHQIGHVYERKRIETKLETLAHYDVVTGLPNRGFFQEILQSTILRASRRKSQFGVLFIDLDNFKQINDTFGHSVGDSLLKEIASKVRNVARDMDYIARIGGDEFVIIVDELTSSDDAALIASRLIKAIAKPYMIENVEINITCSVGIAMYPDSGATDEDLLKHADSAMYRAKDSGKNTFRFYTEKLNKRNIRKVIVENNLRHAIENDELYLVYQPIINLSGTSLVGVEVLLRWESEALGFVAPDEFIPVAESSGLMHDIGDWVLERSLEQLSEWAKFYPDLVFFMNVNCSILQLQNKLFYQKICDIMQSYNIKGEQLILETTETMLMEYLNEVLDQLNPLNELGVRIAIDDFGTGYSSLSYLRKLPISILKIDMSFIADIPDDPNSVAIVKAIIQLSEALGLDVIAEGVETKEQAQCLIELGCLDAQGYHFYKPLVKKDMAKLLNETFK